MRAPSVIVLEFNELSPRLMDELIDAGEVENFARLRAESVEIITDPEAPQASLNPWVQWVTVHTGVGHEEHGLEKLGEADRLAHETMGEAVGRAGRETVIFSTMNLPQRSAGGGIYLPDPWNPSGEPSPEELSPFFEFVRANVQEHTNARARISPGGAARFGAFMLSHGLTRETVTSALRQLWNERRMDTGNFARACVLDRLQWDVFEHYVRRRRPALATVFSNSTAHFQHMYWRNHEPGSFSVQPSAEQQRRYRDAVRTGYRSMDALVGNAIALADDLGATLMLCTGLSQQPYLLAEDAGGKFTYRPRDFEELRAAVGGPASGRVSPVMAGEFHVLFGSSDAAGAAADRFRAATVDGEPAFGVRLVGEDLFTGCRITWDVPEDAELIDADGRSHRFHDLFYRFETAKSGYHHPDGMWWVRTGSRRRIEGKVPLRAVAPTVLQVLGIPVPGSMAAPPVELDAPAA